jgi:hypothetical protein
VPGAARRDDGLERLAVAGLLLAFAIAAALLIWEGRGLTLLADDWQFGFSARTSFDPSAFLVAHNGHFVAVPVALTKLSLQLFGSDAALPLRLAMVAVHLSAAACLFFIVRREIGTVAAAVVTVLVLFLGTAYDVLIGGHGLPIGIAVASGLGAWLALSRRRAGWDVVAAALLVVGVASEATALPFVLAAAALIAVEGGPRRRYWVAVVPLAVFGLWWLKYGGDGGFAIANLAGLPSFAFNSLAASLASITGLFTFPGGRTADFDVSAGQALAGGVLVALLALAVARGYRPGRATAPALVALLGFWVLTAAVADPDRQPISSRYLYVSAILLLLVLAYEVGASPLRRQGAVALAAICAFALLPNIRQLTYGADYARAQSESNRAVMGAANLIEGEATGSVLLEDSANLAPGQFPDLSLPLAQYEASRARFGTPAFSPAQIAAAAPDARAAADNLIARALPIGLRAAGSAPAALSPSAGASQTGGVLKRRNGCLRFVPLAVGAQVTLGLPVGGLWVRPAAGPAVPVGVRRFDELFGFQLSPALGGRASVVGLPPGPASGGWQVQLAPEQPLLLCAA